jgi:hypothetical protein
MNRHSSRALAVGAVLALVLSACGGDDGTVSVPTDEPPADGRRAPVVVEVGAVGGSGGTAEMAADAGAPEPDRLVGDDALASDLSILPFWAGYVYEVGEGLPPLPTADTGYQFPAGATVDAAAVAELAEVLGVAGEPVAGTGRDGDGTVWRIGPDDGSAESLTVIDDGQLSWYLSSAWALQPGFEPCEIVVADDGEVTEEICPEPVAPEGVPTAAEAEGRVGDLLAGLGVDVSGVELETYADDWSASVTVWTVREGVRWPMSWGFGFGAEGALQWASGHLAEPVATGPYPLVDLETAIARLGEQSGWWGGISVAATSEAVREADPGEPTTDEPTTDEPTTDELIPDQPDNGAKPVGEHEPMVATLVDVRADLWWVWDTDGSVWMLPAYTFTDTDGGWHTVPAVTDEFITIAEPEVDPMPLPVEPLDPVIVDTGVIGSSVDDATAALEAQGLSLRVLRLDGEDLVGTMDFVPTRVNVAVEDDVVVEILSTG